MSSILDIDLDYFNEVKEPERRLRELLVWAGLPVDRVVDRHNAALRRWHQLVRRGRLSPPTHILHVDEHNDMLDEMVKPHIGNLMVHAMRSWPECRVHWLVEFPIDSPAMWLRDATWGKLAPRFHMGPRRPRGWPKPDVVSICTSPSFVAEPLRDRLLREIDLVQAEPGVVSSQHHRWHRGGDRMLP